jgi:regulator of PEP synthase PpsR (kinase-PPPase family)
LDEYDSRVEAISYALGSDDGISTKKYDEADVILLGVSRTGKTPVCLYLAFHYGVHAANYPLTEENLEAIHGEAPPVLVPYRKKLCGLTINPERLEQIRARRLPGSRYASFAQCRTEVVRAEAIFASLKLPFFNVTSMSMEEIAVAVLDTMHLPRR